MEASSIRRKYGGHRLGDLFSSRRNTIILALISAVLAGVLLFAFVQQYRNNANTSTASTPVFVATGLIPRGTAASEIAATQLYRRTLIKHALVVQGAIADPSLLQGTVAATNIYPGQQLTATDFTRTNVTIASQLHRADRAIAVPVDATHGMVGFVQPGDHVDLLSDLGGHVGVLARNILVLSAPTPSGGGVGSSNGGGGNMVVRITDAQALAMATAADDGKVWFVLRPPVGALQ